MNKKIGIIGFALGSFAVIAQLVLIIQNRQAPIFETIIRFFSFFTVLTNILVVLFFAISIFQFKHKVFSLLSTKGGQIAITAFILIVGVVYQVALRGVWEPKGMQLIVDELLHSIIPLYVLIYWIIYPAKERVALKEVAKWLLYPLLYMLLILGRGYFSDYYPYPFINIPEIGLVLALVNIAIIFLFMLLVMCILTLIDNKRIKS